jgi:transaldolase/glucose-6-phosphate isomerase
LFDRVFYGKPASTFPDNALVLPTFAANPCMNAINAQTLALGKSLDDVMAAALARWRDGDKVQRLWDRDSGLWSGRDEAKWLDWLGIVERERAGVEDLATFASDVKARGFADILVLGMGGSSLGPEVIAETFPSLPGWPRLRIIDSTDPGQIRETEAAIDLKQTLFVVASKSGSTLEPNMLKDYFFSRARVTLGAQAGSHFVAITDPGSSLEQAAQSDGFWRIFLGVPGIGGRYSVLSRFGLAPAAARGVDVKALLEQAQRMVRACGRDVPVESNPGVLLGLALGAAAQQGRDKLTLIASPGVASFGAWVEQLVAESTGKNGKAILPIDQEPLAAPARYGSDRLFLYLRLAGGADAGRDRAVAALQDAGQPVVTITWEGLETLAQEFFRFEIATAVAGAELSINPFDQPDVELNKIRTRALTTAYQETGALPTSAPVYTDHHFSLFADAANAQALRADGAGSTLLSWLSAHLRRARPGDYFALLAFVASNPRHSEALQVARLAVRNARGIATTIGFGPRFLHSTGQAHKGGPNSGLFLQITAQPEQDLAIPANACSFGIVEAAQAAGDFDVLAEGGRRILRVHLNGAIDRNLTLLANTILQACA